MSILIMTQRGDLPWWMDPVNTKSASYISVFDDHIEGNATTKRAFIAPPQPFSIPTGQYHMHADDPYIMISAGQQQYYIYMKKKKVSQLLAVLPTVPTATSAVSNRAAVSSVPQAVYSPVEDTEKAQVTCFCAKCGACSQLPAHLGRVKVTCPNCNYQFEFNT